MGQWRLARRHDILMVDTTVKSGFSIFAPTWSIVLGLKSGSITWEDYTAEYRRLMNESWKANREKWMEFIQQTEPVAIACYCTGVDPVHRPHCHRYLLKDIFEKLCQAKGIEFRYYGELAP